MTEVKGKNYMSTERVKEHEKVINKTLLSVGCGAIVGGILIYKIGYRKGYDTGYEIANNTALGIMNLTFKRFAISSKTIKNAWNESVDEFFDKKIKGIK